MSSGGCKENIKKKKTKQGEGYFCKQTTYFQKLCNKQYYEYNKPNKQ